MNALPILATALSLMILAAAPAIGGDHASFVCPPGETEVSIFYMDDSENAKKNSGYYIGDKRFPWSSRLFRLDQTGKNGDILYYRGKRCVEVDRLPIMPKELRATWCSRGETEQKASYVRCRKADSEDSLGVDMDKFLPAEETTCYPHRITSQGNGIFRVEAWCSGNPDNTNWYGSVQYRWWLFNNGRRLEIRYAK